MGGGDIKLLFLTGLFLGWQRNILCLLIACVLGIVFAFIFPENVPQETGQRKKTESFFRGGRPSRRQRFSRSFAAARSSARI